MKTLALSLMLLVACGAQAQQTKACTVALESAGQTIQSLKALTAELNGFTDESRPAVVRALTEYTRAAQDAMTETCAEPDEREAVAILDADMRRVTLKLVQYADVRSRAKRKAQ